MIAIAKTTLLALSFFLFLMNDVSAQVFSDFKQGDKIRGSVNIGSDGPFGTSSKRTFFLPEGEWTVLDSRQSLSTPHQEKFIELIIGKIENRKIESFIRIYANVESKDLRWNDVFCTRKNLVYSNKYDSGVWAQKCLEVNHLVNFLTNASGAYAEVRSYLVKNDISYPAVVLSFQFQEYDQHGEYITFSYSVDPTKFGFNSADGPWTSSEWHSDRIDKDNKRAAFLKKFIAWSEEYAAVLDQNFHRKIAFQKDSLTSPITMTPLEN